MFLHAVMAAPLAAEETADKLYLKLRTCFRVRAVGFEGFGVQGLPSGLGLCVLDMV